MNSFSPPQAAAIPVLGAKHNIRKIFTN